MKAIERNVFGVPVCPAATFDSSLRRRLLQALELFGFGVPFSLALMVVVGVAASLRLASDSAQGSPR